MSQLSLIKIDLELPFEISCKSLYISETLLRRLCYNLTRIFTAVVGLGLFIIRCTKAQCRHMLTSQKS